MTARSRLLSRRALLRAFGLGACTLPLASLLGRSPSYAAEGKAERIIFFYFPDGVIGPSQNGDPSQWHPTGSEHAFTLSPLLAPLSSRVDDCLFFTGLTMGPTDSGSHPGGAKKLLTATDHAGGESIDQLLSRTVGEAMPFRHLYLGAQANADGASGDKHITYPSAGQSITPEDDPRKAFDLLFGQAVPEPAPGQEEGAPDPMAVSVIDRTLEETELLRSRLGDVEATKLDLHLEALREVEKRIKGLGATPVEGASCDEPSVDVGALSDATLYAPGMFPTILRAQMDLTVLAMACGLTRVGTIQASHHTSELLMSRFEGTPMYDPSYDMRSHQASHYGASHDESKKEFSAYKQQVTWWVEQFAYLIEALASRPEGDGTMLDHSIVVLCTEVCDGNTHLHDNMPMVVAGGAGGAITTGRLLHTGGARHADLYIALAQAMGLSLDHFGDQSNGPLTGVV